MFTLKDEEDAFGHAVYDYLDLPEGERPLHMIVERDDGHFYTYAIPFYFRGFDEWPSHERKSMRLVRGKVLDVGTGAARVSLYLQDRGIDVTGIDNSPLAIEVCKKRGLANAFLLPAELIGSDLGIFDTVIMFGSLFFGNSQSVRRLLKRLADVTSDKGRIIAEWGYDTETDMDEDNLSYRRRNLDRKRMEGLSRIRLRYKKYVTPWFTFLAASNAELGLVLAGTPWKLRRYIESGESRHVAILDKK
jgi:SAM-dependent methyltransferase